jgi:hypothetical protein
MYNIELPPKSMQEVSKNEAIITLRIMQTMWLMQAHNTSMNSGIINLTIAVFMMRN